MATAGTAAWLHGLSGFGPGTPPAVVALETRRNYRVSASEVHSTTRLHRDDRLLVHGVPTLSVARALFSLAALVPGIPLAVVANAVDEAVRDRKATDAWLRAALERIRCRGRNGVRVFEQILDDRSEAPTESWLGAQVLEVIDRADLPRPTVQARVSWA